MAPSNRINTISLTKFTAWLWNYLWPSSVRRSRFWKQTPSQESFVIGGAVKKRIVVDTQQPNTIPRNTTHQDMLAVRRIGLKTSLPHRVDRCNALWANRRRRQRKKVWKQPSTAKLPRSTSRYTTRKTNVKRIKSIIDANNNLLGSSGDERTTSANDISPLVDVLKAMVNVLSANVLFNLPYLELENKPADTTADGAWKREQNINVVVFS